MIIRSIAAAAVFVAFLAPMANASVFKPSPTGLHTSKSVLMVNHSYLKGKDKCKKGYKAKGNKCLRQDYKIF